MTMRLPSKYKAIVRNAFLQSRLKKQDRSYELVGASGTAIEVVERSRGAF
jgi:hypothetical protein